MTLRNPQVISVETLEGEQREYVIHHMAAFDGRKVAVCYTQGALPKIGDYDVNEAMSLLMMRYVGIAQENGELLMLTTKGLIENHVPDWETLAKIEIEMLKYNTSFFQNGKALSLLKEFSDKGTELISSTLTDLLERLSQAEKLP